MRGWAMAEQGHVEEGIAQMQEGLAAFRAIGTGIVAAALLFALLAEACMEAGRLDDGLSALTEAHGAQQMNMEAVNTRLRYIGSKASCC